VPILASFSWIFSGLGLYRAKKLSEIFPASRVDDIAGLEPTAPGLPDPESHEIQVVEMVSIRRDGDLDSHVLGHPAVGVGEIQPVGMTVQFEKAPLPKAWRFPG
jgi:hypothetical protein